jgi:ribonuclease P protein component
LRNRFKKQNRLLDSKEYSFVFNKAEKIGNRYFIILFRKNNKIFPRLGLIIAKKNIKHAVNRNKIKRIVRESFRNKVNNLNENDYIFLAKKEISQLSNLELRYKLDEKWKKLLIH